MDIASRFVNYFDHATRQRALPYTLNGSIRFEDTTSDLVAGWVRGEAEYFFYFEAYGRTMECWCDCPFFASGNFCKHLWAVLIEAGKRGYLSDSSRAVRLTQGSAPDGDDYEDPDDPFGFDFEGDFALTPPEPAIPALRGPSWRTQIGDVQSMALRGSRATRQWPAKRQVLYFVDAQTSLSRGGLAIGLSARDLKLNGDYSKTVRLDIRRNEIEQLPSQIDREILTALVGGLQLTSFGYTDSRVADIFSLDHQMAVRLLPLMAETGRLFYRSEAGEREQASLTWDEHAWNFGLEIHKGPYRWALSGVLFREMGGVEERLDLLKAALIIQGGFVFTRERAAPLDPGVPFEWISYLRRAGAIEVPDHDREEFLTALLNSAHLPRLKVPEELQFDEVAVPMRPALRVSGSGPNGSRLHGDLQFDYDGRLVSESSPGGGVYDASARRFIRRDPAAEKQAAVRLSELGLRSQGLNTMQSGWDIPPAKLPRTVRALLEDGWHVEADGKSFRKAGAFKVEVNSGVDWFELHAEVDYGDAKVRLPELLQALRSGNNLIRLGDGGYGMVPEEWLAKFGLIAALGEAVDGHIRFKRSQTGLLDALLAAQPEATFDETFAHAREELRSFEGVKAAPQPEGFTGQLRDYQREGVGWMEFLRRFSFGGCLADDMGVGKTAQMLGVLETRRAARESGEEIPSSLVVVPKSLVFNWKEEAAKFTPKLRVLDYTGTGRTGADLNDFDVILTTYGTLRRDAARLKDVEFDYIVLDEAQAIKNANSESAKAARLLKGRHKVAMSGTPVENHLGELWSLFDFLNPGMLGAASVLKLSGGAARNPDQDTRVLLAQALRPFILRRTKDQVARELPPRTEQTIYCELDTPQRKLYNELRQHYRDGLLKRIETAGIKKSSFQVLEALLRLRQAACHPGLIDKKRTGEPSAKIDTLLAQLHEVLDEGHKSLVFSQFTSLLDILRNRLDKESIGYEYLDGATRDRQAHVERFQNDPDCKLFLISLKAGGVGLNLTAAEYVFLLDPWWNPAVEAQAMDRAHRIGQTKQVFAYRLIARDTVEEKVLELQKSKRDLASAIISADNSLIRNLKKEDLELLLS
ncbi:MAG: DEAD/DEAH box helicase [Acidobacteriota bacterium]|nr:DEAD/DEAH box helicase [Acidobacteriota bacterium]